MGQLSPSASDKPVAGYCENTVTFKKAVTYGFKGTFRWNGRASRSEYWLWFLFASTAHLCLLILLSIQVAHLSSSDECSGCPPDPSSSQPVGLVVVLSLLWIVTLVFELALFFPTLAVTIRRLHDAGRSAWWVISQFIVGVVASVLAVVTFAFAAADALYQALLDTTENGGSSYKGELPAVASVLFGTAGLLMLLVFALGIVVLVFTLTKSTSKPTKWDEGYRPSAPLSKM